MLHCLSAHTGLRQAWERTNDISGHESQTLKLRHGQKYKMLHQTVLCTFLLTQRLPVTQIWHSFCVPLCILQRCYCACSLAQLTVLTCLPPFSQWLNLGYCSIHKLIKSRFGPGLRTLFWLTIVLTGLKTLLAPHNYGYMFVSLFSPWLVLKVVDWNYLLEFQYILPETTDMDSSRPRWGWGQACNKLPLVKTVSR